MNYTDDQDIAIGAIYAWLPSDEPYFTLFGFAGTGKTTLMADVAKMTKRTVWAIAPTNKAARILKNKMPEGVICRTFHSAVYSLEPTEQQELERLLAKSPKTPYDVAEIDKLMALKFKNKAKAEIKPDDLVICDEASMLTVKMARDLIATKAKVLFVGDSFQLPPVPDKHSPDPDTQQSFFDSIHAPDAMLERICRQDEQGDIARLAMQIRLGNRIQQIKNNVLYCCDASEIYKPSHNAHPLTWADQIIVGKHKTRRMLNRYVRELLGRTVHTPEKGDRLICTYNVFDMIMKLKGRPKAITGLVNSSECVAVETANVERTNHDSTEWAQELNLAVDFEGKKLVIDIFEEPFIETRNLVEMKKWYRSGRGGRLIELDYAYALTAHKAQGSEWPNVVVVDDGLGYTSNERLRWLYTAVTRAQSKLVVAKA